jgi:hypothetical protein
MITLIVSSLAYWSRLGGLISAAIAAYDGFFKDILGTV